MGINNILKKVEIFKSLKHTDIEKINLIIEKRNIIEGEILATAKEKADFFFILVSGDILVSMEKEKSVVMSTSGDFIGMNLILSKGIYTSHLTALSNGKVLVINHDDFIRTIQEDSHVFQSIMTAWTIYLDKIAPFIKK
ncbi:MAG: hypothetical protein B6I26_02895 [Desulfobacteraceae bacterium 4572_130]|nr:MAG: hypothetical protein B6I26_02895 [Desulfobacteraceae bacterium 4572_130]